MGFKGLSALFLYHEIGGIRRCGFAGDGRTFDGTGYGFGKDFGDHAMSLVGSPIPSDWCALCKGSDNMSTRGGHEVAFFT